MYCSVDRYANTCIQSKSTVGAPHLQFFKDPIISGRSPEFHLDTMAARKTRSSHVCFDTCYLRLAAPARQAHCSKLRIVLFFDIADFYDNCSKTNVSRWKHGHLNELWSQLRVSDASDFGLK